MKAHIALTLLLVFGFAAVAETPLKFKAWKEQQIVEAQNEVLRISARLRAQKNAPKTEKSTDTDLLSSSRFQQAPEVTTGDLKNAQETLTIAKEFTLEDYADVYVSNLQEEPEQFTKLMNSLSKDEMAQLMKILVKNKNPEASQQTNDAKRSKNPASATLASSVPRA
jgi:hypothetical protein